MTYANRTEVPRRCHAVDPREPQTVDQIDRTSTEEVCPMSTMDTNGSTGRGVKTLAIRLDPDLHAQLTLIAQLRGATITDEIKAALDAHITAAKTMPELAGQAEAALAEIEREAATRRDALATLFGPTEPTATITDSVEPPAQPDGKTSGTRGRGGSRPTS